MLIISCSTDPVQRCSNTAKAGKPARCINHSGSRWTDSWIVRLFVQICQFCSLHAVKQQWCKLVMSFTVMEQHCPLCILHWDEARFHLCFMPSVNNIIRCGAHSCSTCECVSVCVEYSTVSGQLQCVSQIQHTGFKMKQLRGEMLSVCVLFLLGKNAACISQYSREFYSYWTNPQLTIYSQWQNIRPAHTFTSTRLPQHPWHKFHHQH